MSEKLDCRVLVTHDSCADGLASALLAADGVGGLDVIFLHYNSPAHVELEPKPGMVFCDMTPHRSRVQDFVAAGAWCLDHHAYAKDIVEAFGDRGVFASEPGRSGASLAYEYLWRGNAHHAQRFAELAGIRDTWQKDDPSWEAALELHSTLMRFPRRYWLRRPDAVDRAMLFALTLGPDLVAAERADVERALNTQVLRVPTSDGWRWGIFADRGGLMSDVAELARARDEYDVLIGWHARTEDDAPITIFSLRSAVVDVGAIAKECGGGGHAAAAGFRVAGWGDAMDVARAVAAQAAARGRRQ